MLEAYFKAKTLSDLESRLPRETAQVEQTLTAMLADAPDDTRVLFALARCHLFRHEEDEASKLLEKILRQQPEHTPAKIELAKSRFRAKRLPEAIQLLTEVANNRPEYDELWRVLAGWLTEDGQKEAGQETSKQYAMIRAFNEKVQVAEKAFAAGDPKTADAICRQLLQLVPNEIRTLRLLARIGKSFSHFEFCIETLSRCVETRPQDTTLRLEYAHALLSGRRYQESLEQCQRILDVAPEFLSAYELKAEVLYNLAQYDAAAQIYRALSELPGKRPQTLLHLGKVLKTTGDTAEATACYQKAAEIDPSLGQSYWELASLRSYRFSDEQQESMRRALDAESASPLDKVLVQFALAKALEDAGRYEESFQHCDAANAGYLAIRPYRYISQNDRLISCFTEDYFAARRQRGLNSVAPIFVVGLPRSGSTLMEQILSSHSQVDATQELDEIVSIARSLATPGQQGQEQYPQSLAMLGEDETRRLAQRYLDFVQPYRKGGPLFVDKAPHNFAHIGLIKTLFPNAKIIDIRRNPMASGWSLYRQFFGDSFLFSYSLEAIASYYKDYVALMDHWHAVMPGQILTLRYEDLVNDLSGVTTAALEYCGLEFEEACLDFHLNRRPVATPSSEQVRQPLYSDALDHWRNFEPYLGRLKQALEETEGIGTR